MLLDIGAVQADALTVDRLASLEKVLAMYGDSIIVTAPLVHVVHIAFSTFYCLVTLVFHISTVCTDSYGTSDLYIVD